MAGNNRRPQRLQMPPQPQPPPIQPPRGFAPPNQQINPNLVLNGQSTWPELTEKKRRTEFISLIRQVAASKAGLAAQQFWQQNQPTDDSSLDILCTDLNIEIQIDPADDFGELVRESRQLCDVEAHQYQNNFDHGDDVWWYSRV